MTNAQKVECHEHHSKKIILKYLKRRNTMNELLFSRSALLSYRRYEYWCSRDYTCVNEVLSIMHTIRNVFHLHATNGSALCPSNAFQILISGAKSHKAMFNDIQGDLSLNIFKRVLRTGLGIPELVIRKGREMSRSEDPTFQKCKITNSVSDASDMFDGWFPKKLADQGFAEIWGNECSS